MTTTTKKLDPRTCTYMLLRAMQPVTRSQIVREIFQQVTGVIDVPAAQKLADRFITDERKARLVCVDKDDNFPQDRSRDVIDLTDKGWEVSGKLCREWSGNRS